jgi:uncharacterized protein involved in exopolysaccharide biosynthesis
VRAGVGRLHEEDLPTLGRYLRFVSRHGWLIGVLMTAGVVSGVVWGWQQPPTYEARSSIALQPVPAYVSIQTSRQPPDVTIDTDAQLFRSPEVLDAVAAATGGRPDEVPDRVRITATPLSRVLHVTVEATSPTAAAAGANAAADAFVAARAEHLGALQEEQALALAARVAQLRERISSRRSLELNVGAADTTVAEVRALEARLRELDIARLEPAEVIRVAEPPTEAEPVNVSVRATSAAMVGLLLALGIGAARDQRRSATAQRSGATPRREGPVHDVEVT